MTKPTTPATETGNRAALPPDPVVSPQVLPAARSHALAVAWEEALKPQAVALQIKPQSGALVIVIQPIAFHQYGINE